MINATAINAVPVLEDVHVGRTTAKAFAKDVFTDQERKLGDRRRSDTVVVLTINHADQRLGVVSFMTPSAPYEKSKFLGSGGSMVARLKLKGIDGRAPPRSGACGSICLNTEKLTRSRHSKDGQIGSSFLIPRVVPRGRSQFVESLVWLVPLARIDRLIPLSF